MTDSIEFLEKIKGKNINSKTFLATDYLNHFNEIIMLIEIIPDMPELIIDVKKWRPKSYIEHFQASSFVDKDLAVEGYNYVPANYKKAFEYLIDEMNLIILSVIDNLEILKNSREDLLVYSKKMFSFLHGLIEAASAIINGTELPNTQNNVDSILKN